jgi:hypothetical protein
LTRRQFGETLARITDAFPRWFAGRYASFTGRIDSLPVDQHMLLARYDWQSFMDFSDTLRK